MHHLSWPARRPKRKVSRALTRSPESGLNLLLRVLRFVEDPLRRFFAPMRGEIFLRIGKRHVS